MTQPLVRRNKTGSTYVAAKNGLRGGNKRAGRRGGHLSRLRENLLFMWARRVGRAVKLKHKSQRGDPRNGGEKCQNQNSKGRALFTGERKRA